MLQQDVYIIFFILIIWKKWIEKVWNQANKLQVSYNESAYAVCDTDKHF